MAYDVDPYLSKVVVGLALDGANGSTSFPTYGPYSPTVSPVGSAAISTAQSKYGGASLRIPGAGSRLQAASSDVARAAGDVFCVEAWCYLDALGGSNDFTLFHQYQDVNVWSRCYVTPAGAVVFQLSGTFAAASTSAGVFPAAAWTHVRCQYEVTSPGNWANKVFINFAYVAQMTWAGVGASNSGTTLHIGGDKDGGTPFVGYIDDFRYTRAPRWPGQFGAVPDPGIPNPHVEGWPGSVFGPLAAPTFPLAWPVGVREAPGAERLRRVDYGGFGQIVGTVKRVNTPADTPLRRRVRLIRDRDGVCVGETWSDATTGAYAFAGFDPAERYSVVSYDHAHVFRAVIADHLLPEVWP